MRHAKPKNGEPVTDDMTAQPRMSWRRRVAHDLVHAAEALHAWRPQWPPGWLVRLGDYFSTAAAGALDVLAAFLLVLPGA